MTISIQRDGTRWTVTGEGFTTDSGDVAFAACLALGFAANLGSMGSPELGAGVPGDALERGRTLRGLLDRYGQG